MGNFDEVLDLGLIILLNLLISVKVKKDYPMTFIIRWIESNRKVSPSSITIHPHPSQLFRIAWAIWTDLSGSGDVF